MRYFLCCLCSMLLYCRALCQLGVGTGEQLYIASGVIFSTDSLVFIPSSNLTLTNNTIIPAYAPVPGTTPGTNSIARVYDIGSPIVYSGELGIVYDVTEFAGNAEGLLQIAYDSTAWRTTTTSTVNSASRYVSNVVSAANIDRVTATQAGTVLPVTYIAFTALLQEDFVQLKWKMGDTEGLNGFAVQYSDDGVNWQTATELSATEYTTDYSYQHRDLQFSTRHFRIASYEQSGAIVYTPIISIRNGMAGTNLRVTKNGDGLYLYFYGKQPSQVQVLNMKGQLLQVLRVAQQPMRIGKLPQGAYVVHYVVDGRKMSRIVIY